MTHTNHYYIGITYQMPFLFICKFNIGDCYNSAAYLRICLFRYKSDISLAIGKRLQMLRFKFRNRVIV